MHFGDGARHTGRAGTMNPLELDLESISASFGTGRPRERPTLESSGDHVLSGRFEPFGEERRLDEDASPGMEMPGESGHGHPKRLAIGQIAEGPEQGHDQIESPLQ